MVTEKRIVEGMSEEDAMFSLVGTYALSLRFLKYLSELNENVHTGMRFMDILNALDELEIHDYRIHIFTSSATCKSSMRAVLTIIKSYMLGIVSIQDVERIHTCPNRQIVDRENVLEEVRKEVPNFLHAT